MYKNLRNSATRRTNNDEMEESVNCCFDKKFTFKPPMTKWPLMAPDKMFEAKKWEVPNMVKMKKELNEKKSQLNNFDLEKWHKHTRATNSSGNVVRHLRKTIDPEFLTQAWCKFYELCATYPVIPEAAVEEGILNSVHLCEAPGAFVAALNHFVKLNHPEMKWEWIATTLNPHYEENELSVMVPDDRFMLLTLDHWKFGPNQTGNLKQLENMKSLVAESVKLGPVLLVTADGSIDCIENPAEQEGMVASLLFCEIITALHILSKGGTLVVKMFTMYEHTTICLMYLLNTCFETVHVHKPATSKEGNSENYVICVNYDGTDERKTWLRQLRNYYGPAMPTSAMYPLLEIPETFIEQLLQCAEKFKTYQEEVLERNILLFTIGHEPLMRRIKTLRHRMAEVFVSRYGLRPLQSENQEIVGKTRLKKQLSLQLDFRNEDGTFNQRKERDSLPVSERLDLCLKDLGRFSSKWNFSSIRWLKFPHMSRHFKVLKGKPVKTVRTSKFCSVRLLELRAKLDAILIENGYLESIIDWNSCTTQLSVPVRETIQRYCPDVLREKCHIINFNDILWTPCFNGNNDTFGRKALIFLLESLEDAWRDSNLIIEGYPMLTQFSAGVIFMLSHLFEQVGFIEPQEGSCAVILRQYKSTDVAMKEFMKHLTHEAEIDLENVDPTKEAILAVIPVNEIVENSEFYETVYASNMAALMSQMIKKIMKALELPVSS